MAGSQRIPCTAIRLLQEGGRGQCHLLFPIHDMELHSGKPSSVQHQDSIHRTGILRNPLRQPGEGRGERKSAYHTEHLPSDEPDPGIQEIRRQRNAQERGYCQQDIRGSHQLSGQEVHDACRLHLQQHQEERKRRYSRRVMDPRHTCRCP